MLQPYIGMILTGLVFQFERGLEEVIKKFIIFVSQFHFGSIDLNFLLAHHGDNIILIKWGGFL